MSNLISILYINDDGSGFANNLQIPEGTTIGQFYSQQTGQVSPRGNHIVSVNGGKYGGLVMADQVLKDKDTVSFIHANIKGEEQS